MAGASGTLPVASFWFVSCIDASLYPSLLWRAIHLVQDSEEEDQAEDVDAAVRGSPSVAYCWLAFGATGKFSYNVVWCCSD